jgi:hypothetical protein
VAQSLPHISVWLRCAVSRFRSLRASRYQHRLRASRRCIGQCRWVVCSLWSVGLVRPPRNHSAVSPNQRMFNGFHCVRTAARNHSIILLRVDLPSHVVIDLDRPHLRDAGFWPVFLNVVYLHSFRADLVMKKMSVSGVGVSIISFFISDFSFFFLFAGEPAPFVPCFPEFPAHGSGWL